MSSSELFAKFVKKQPVEQKQKGEKKTTLQNKKQIVVEKEIQQQEIMYQEMKKLKESENDKSADVSDINKSG